MRNTAARTALASAIVLTPGRKKNTTTNERHVTELFFDTRNSCLRNSTTVLRTLALMHAWVGPTVSRRPRPGRTSCRRVLPPDLLLRTSKTGAARRGFCSEQLINRHGTLCVLSLSGPVLHAQLRRLTRFFFTRCDMCRQKCTNKSLLLYLANRWDSID